MKRTYILRLVILLFTCLSLLCSCGNDENWFYGVWFSGDKSLIIQEDDRIELNNIEAESPYYTNYWRAGDALFVKVGKNQQTLELNPKEKTLTFMGDTYEREGASAFNSLYPWIYGTWSRDSSSPFLVISPTQIIYYDSNGKVLAKGKYTIKQGHGGYSDSELNIKWNRPNDLTVRLVPIQEGILVGGSKDPVLLLWEKSINQGSGSRQSMASISSKQSSTSKYTSSSTQKSDICTDEERFGIYSQNDSNDNSYSSSIKGGKIVGKWTHVLQSGGDIGSGNFRSEVLVETLTLNSNGSGRLETRYKEYVGNSLISSRSGGSFTFSWEFDGSTVYIDGSPEFTYRNGSLIDLGGNAFTK